MAQKIKALSEFEFVGESGVDGRKRVSLSKALAALKTRIGEHRLDEVHFRVYVNAAGQVLLEPAVAVPVRELWLYRNPVALAKVREGLAQAARGKMRDRGSFARHAAEEID